MYSGITGFGIRISRISFGIGFDGHIPGVLGAVTGSVLPKFKLKLAFLTPGANGAMLNFSHIRSPLFKKAYASNPV